MKARKIYIVLGLMALLCGMVSCENDKYCKCVTVEDEPQTIFVNVATSMNCQSISKIGTEDIVSQSLQREMVNVKCKRTTADEAQHL